MSDYVEFPDEAFDALIEEFEIYQNYLNSDAQ